MSQIFVNIGLSLDGYMAPGDMTLERWDIDKVLDSPPATQLRYVGR